MDRSNPFQSPKHPDVKREPLTVMMKDEPAATALEGDSELITGVFVEEEELPPQLIINSAKETMQKKVKVRINKLHKKVFVIFPRSREFFSRILIRCSSKEKGSCLF